MTAVVFDFGNVLYHFDYLRMARALAGDDASFVLENFIGSPLQVAYESGRAQLDDVLAEFARLGFPVDRARFLEAFLDVFHPVAGMAQVVRILGRRRPLGLLSNTSPEHARMFIETVPEVRFIPTRVYSFEVGHLKPDPAIYSAAVKAMGVPAQEIVFTDDIPELAAASASVGMTGIQFRGAADLTRRLIGLGFRELEDWDAEAT